MCKGLFKIINPDLEEKKCLQCYLGFYYDENFECKRIPIPFCLIGDKNTCTSCVTGTELKDGKCVVEEIFLEGCFEYNEDRTCKRCSDNYDLNECRCTLKNPCP